MLKKILKAVGWVAVLVFVALIVFMPKMKTEGATITFVTSNYSNGTWYFQTNTVTTAGTPGGQGPASISFVYSNQSNGVTYLLTNTISTAIAEEPYYVAAPGYDYGVTNGHVGFFGYVPVTQQIVTVGEANTTTVTNLVNALKRLGLLQ